jgi:myosin heavy subunit
VKSGGARASATAFVVKHSFADIMYECDGFITQNKQSHLPDIAITTLATSSIPFVAADVAQTAAALINPTAGTTPAAEEANKRVSVGRIKGPSTNTFLMSKTRNMMNTLLEKVAVTDRLTYALCIATAKSCKEGAPPLSAFASTEFVKDQCKYFALPQLISFAQKGFAYSKSYLEFYQRFCGAMAHFTPLLPPVTSENERVIAANAQALSRALVQNLLPLLLQMTQAGWLA